MWELCQHLTLVLGATEGWEPQVPYSELTPSTKTALWPIRKWHLVFSGGPLHVGGSEMGTLHATQLGDAPGQLLCNPKASQPEGCTQTLCSLFFHPCQPQQWC